MSCLFFYSPGDHRYLPSFPTRRSSDLNERRLRAVEPAARESEVHLETGAVLVGIEAELPELGRNALLEDALHRRSEEHTSELQSRRDLVCRLLLEKKNKKNTTKLIK